MNLFINPALGFMVQRCAIPAHRWDVGVLYFKIHAHRFPYDTDSQNKDVFRASAEMLLSQMRIFSAVGVDCFHLPVSLISARLTYNHRLE